MFSILTAWLIGFRFRYRKLGGFLVTFTYINVSQYLMLMFAIIFSSLTYHLNTTISSLLTYTKCHLRSIDVSKYDIDLTVLNFILNSVSRETYHSCHTQSVNNVCVGVTDVYLLQILVYLMKHTIFVMCKYMPIFLTCIRSGQVRSGQVRSECLTCTLRASCCSARLSWAQVPAFAASDIHIWPIHISWGKTLHLCVSTVSVFWQFATFWWSAIILLKKGKIYLVEEMWWNHWDSTPH